MSEEQYGKSEIEVSRFSVVDMQMALNEIMSLKARISKHELKLTQQEKHYLKELEELSKRNLDLFHENMILKEKLK